MGSHFQQSEVSVTDNSGSHPFLTACLKAKTAESINVALFGGLKCKVIDVSIHFRKTLFSGFAK